jgi:hypothetical protein
MEPRYATLVNGKISPSNGVELVMRDGKVTKNRSSGPRVNLRSYNMPSKEHKIFILGDSHSRKCAANVKPHLTKNFEIEGLVKPGSGTNILVTSAKNYIKGLSKRDVRLFSGDANDTGKNNPKQALKHIVDFMKLNNHTNIALLSIPHRHDVPNSSSENNDIRTLNSKLRKYVKTFNHILFLDTDYNRNFFIYHGQHLKDWERNCWLIK